ncbi:MAG TPA: adenylate/guanylate cyclase domain-containing protein, partial [Cyanobacteria bacterium UBA11368]|nr:adenylate/guanylate cyclase domain-containing protein [Cyanobacteria bacterium UBA11368]
NNLVLPDLLISRHHAILQYNEDGGFYLLDLISTNGSFVNGIRAIVPVRLRHGDRIKFGNTNLAFCCLSTNLVLDATSTQDTSNLPTTTRCVWRLASVIVVELRNLTLLTQQIDKQVLAAALATWCREIANIITSLGGLVEKNVGNEVGVIKAIWFHRYHGTNKEDIIRVFQAISAINKRTIKFNQELSLPFPFRIKAGINTGYGIVDNIRRGESLYYLSLEPTFNAASLLASATQKIGCDLALAESTYKYLSMLNNLESIFQQYTVNLKEYNNPVVTYAGLFADIDKFVKSISSPSRAHHGTRVVID